MALAGVAQLVGASSHRPKGHGFDSQSGYMPRLWVWSLVGAHMAGNQSKFLSLSLSLPSPISKVKECVLG